MLFNGCECGTGYRRTLSPLLKDTNAGAHESHSFPYGFPLSLSFFFKLNRLVNLCFTAHPSSSKSEVQLGTKSEIYCISLLTKLILVVSVAKRTKMGILKPFHCTVLHIPCSQELEYPLLPQAFKIWRTDGTSLLYI